MGLAWFVVVVLSGLIALCARAAADPVPEEEAGDAETSLDLLELDPVAALDISRLVSAEELAILTPALGSIERDELDAGEEIAAAPPPSRWGRIDLGVSWRRLANPSEMTRVDDQLWLVLTWRR